MVKFCVVFINIGFLDRIGDEIYIFMLVGVFVDKVFLKVMLWIKVYEIVNVVVGFRCGLLGRV